MRQQYPVVFFSRMAQGVPAQGPVQRLLPEACFVCPRGETLRFFANSYPDLPAFRIRNLGVMMTGMGQLREARMIVTGAYDKPILDACPGVRKMMIFHGTFRCLSGPRVEELAKFDDVVLVGPRMERQLLQVASSFPFRYHTLGYAPFAEFPECTPQNRARIKRKLGLNPELPMVFYAPARRDCGSWVTHAERIAREVPSAYGLVMRPHPNQALHSHASEQELFTRLQCILRDRGNGLIDMVSCSFPELMCAADLLISDATSPTEEFMFYHQKPQIITETMSREGWISRYKRDKLDADSLAELAGLYDCAFSFARDGYTDWGQAVAHALAHADQHLALRKSYFSATFGEDPQGAPRRIADCIRKAVAKV